MCYVPTSLSSLSVKRVHFPQEQPRSHVTSLSQMLRSFPLNHGTPHHSSSYGITRQLRTHRNDSHSRCALKASSDLSRKVRRHALQCVRHVVRCTLMRARSHCEVPHAHQPHCRLPRTTSRNRNVLHWVPPWNSSCEALLASEYPTSSLRDRQQCSRDMDHSNFAS